MQARNAGFPIFYGGEGKKVAVPILNGKMEKSSLSPFSVRWQKIFVITLALMAVSYLFLSSALLILARRGKKPQLTLATTTSVQDSGLLDALLPPFELKNNCRVKVIAVGTGQAIRLAKEGDVDAVIVHDPVREEMFVEEGYGAKRYSFMHNDFVIVGPEEDPARIKGEKGGTEALNKIVTTKSTFISRGDDSGTHRKEKDLWKLAGIEPSGTWYIEAGGGMVETLRIANERRAYALTDRGTYIAHRKELALTILVEGDRNFYNPYSIIPLSREKYPQAKYELAMKLVEFITGVDGQDIIRTYGQKDYGESLFYPDSSGLIERK